MAAVIVSSGRKLSSVHNAGRRAHVFARRPRLPACCRSRNRGSRGVFPLVGRSPTDAAARTRP